MSWKEKLPKQNKYYETENGILYLADNKKILNLIDEKMIKLTFTSPPYNIHEKRKTDSVVGEKYGEQSYDDSLDPEEYYLQQKKIIGKILKISDILVYNIQLLSKNKRAIIKILNDYLEEFKDIIVWNKKSGPPSINDCLISKKTELLLIFQEKKITEDSRKIYDCNFKRGQLFDILEITNKENNYRDEHKAVFPLSLALKIIKNFSREKDIILDPYSGTGTTLVASEKLNRRWIGIEINEKYAKITKERIKKTIEQKKLNNFF